MLANVCSEAVNGIDSYPVEAVADALAAGRAKAAARSHALRQYADHREMLEKERPDLWCAWRRAARTSTTTWPWHPKNAAARKTRAAIQG
jgi:hypothetical protein